MKRVLLSLWLVGAAAYAVTTLHFAHIINNPKRESTVPNESASPSTKNVSAGASTYPKLASSKPIETPGINNEASQADDDKSHAISPDQIPSEVPAVGLESSAIPAEEQLPIPVEAAPGPNVPPVPKNEDLLRVISAASIRNGPSTSALVIGTAHAGAQVEVVSRDVGWVQIVDPASRRSGWIYSRFLSPNTASGGVSSTEVFPAKQPAGDATQELRMVKQKSKARQLANGRIDQDLFASSKQHSKGRQTQESVGLPYDYEFVAPRQRGRFGLFAKRRMWRETTLPSLDGWSMPR
jgi:uncharacterized protein YgiM (DUF1202 family)